MALHMTTSQRLAKTRIDEIEALLPPLYRVYDHAARCSDEHTRAWQSIHNLESERQMLSDIVTHGPIVIK